MKIFHNRHPSSTAIPSENNQPFFQRKGDDSVVNPVQEAFFSGRTKFIGSKGPFSVQTSQGMIQKQEAGTPTEDAGSVTQDAETTTADAGTTEPEAPQHPTCYGRTLTQAEIEQRLAIYQDMVRGIAREIPQRNNILRAMCSFSVRQLTLMREAGVRFWPQGELLPLPGHNVDIGRSGLSAYTPAVRTIRLSTSSVEALRHELAHAWDHVRIMSRRFRLDDASERIVEQTIGANQDMGADASTRHRLMVGGTRVRMSIPQMYDAYRERMRGRPREQAFGTSIAREGYSLSSAREFYAEGYTVFNSGLDEQQARMRSLAPELYEYLRIEAARERLPVPQIAEEVPSTE